MAGPRRSAAVAADHPREIRRAETGRHRPARPADPPSASRLHRRCRSSRPPPVAPSASQSNARVSPSYRRYCLRNWASVWVCSGMPRLLTEPDTRLSGRRQKRYARAHDLALLQKMPKHRRLAGARRADQDREAVVRHHIQRESLLFARFLFFLVALFRAGPNAFSSFSRQSIFAGRILPVTRSPTARRMTAAIIRHTASVAAARPPSVGCFERRRSPR